MGDDSKWWKDGFAETNMSLTSFLNTTIGKDSRSEDLRQRRFLLHLLWSYGDLCAIREEIEIVI
jgi:hypothetical protein